jgi:hypothetical protein
MSVLTPFQKKALAVEKTRAAVTLAQKQPGTAEAIVAFMPDTPKMRLHKITLLRSHVAAIKNQLETQALAEEAQSQVEYSLGIAADQLKKLTAQSARHRQVERSRTIGTHPISGEAAKKKEYELRSQLASASSQVQAAAHAFGHGSATHRHQASTRLTVLHATIASLKYRLRLLQKGLAAHDSRVIDSHDLQHQLTRLSLPRMFKAPDRGEAGAAIRLIASNRPRRAHESEDQYRATLKAYLKRALLRSIHKQHLNQGTAIAEGVSEALQEDGAAIEQAAKLGGVPADELGNAVDAAVQDSAAEIEQAVIDFQPDASSVVRQGLVRRHAKQAAEEALEQAAQESMALAAEGEEQPLDQLVTLSSDGSVAAVVAKPFYMKKEFLIAAAVAAAALLVLRR